MLHQISDRAKDDASEKADEPRKLIAELELMLQKEIKEFEVILNDISCLPRYYYFLSSIHELKY